MTTSLFHLATPNAGAGADVRSPQYQDLKGRIHNELLSRLNLERLARVKREDAEPEIKDLILTLLERESQTTPLSLFERDSLITDVLHEIFGLGPLEALLKDPNISDILVNRYDQVYVEREGRLEETDITFQNDAHLYRIIERIVSMVGRRIDESSPMVDARLQDGSRVNAVIPPLALDGPVLSIRRFRTDRIGAQDLVGRESLTQPMLDFLQGAVAARMNMIVSGGTGAGKTTLLNALSSFIRRRRADRHDRGRGRAHAAAAPCGADGNAAGQHRRPGRRAPAAAPGQCLRMRPDRIIVGEVRGEEALDMLQAMNTGHDGSLTTIHANSPRDALYRLDTMVAMANLNIPDRAVRQQIASAVNLLVQISRMPDGTRKVTGHLRNHRDGGGRHHDAGHFRVRAHRPDAEGKVTGPVPGDRHATEVCRAARDDGHSAAHRHVRTRASRRVRT